MVEVKIYVVKSRVAIIFSAAVRNKASLGVFVNELG
jgi:hypothetical protein